MTRKHAELERELIDDLVPRTGRTLAQWMAEIDAAGLAGKNEIIDWLRPRGFSFANASWLERIHNNGGRPIYLDGAARNEGGLHTMPAVRPAPAVVPRPLPVAPAAAPAPIAQSGSLSDTLARGKAFRPLAEMVLRQLEAALPGVMLTPSGDLVGISKPAEFAVLHVSPRELRLGLVLPATFTGDTVQKARIPGAGAHITHMVILTDARQVGLALLDLARSADQSANG